MHVKYQYINEVMFGAQLFPASLPQESNDEDDDDDDDQCNVRRQRRRNIRCNLHEDVSLLRTLK